VLKEGRVVADKRPLEVRSEGVMGDLRERSAG
jgi:hypothetical protein